MPAGNLAKLEMALQYGADAVYVGASGFSLRSAKVEFDPQQLHQATQRAHALGKKLYVAINLLASNDDLRLLVAWFEATSDIRFDALIVADLGVLALAREMRPDLPIHISTQVSTSNYLAARCWKEAGASRVILARETSLAEAREIADRSGIQVETFVHGAMCVAVSGRCLLSAHLSGRSASKGECKQTCRWQWQLVEKRRPGEAIPVFEEGGETIFLGSTDLCLIEHIPQVVRSGVCSVKVEGRVKSEYYVANVARVYRAALDRFVADPEGYEPDPSWLDELESVSHRPYSTGFAFGYPDDPQRLQTHNRLVSTASVVASVRSMDPAGGYELDVKSRLFVGETVQWIAPNMANGHVRVVSIVNVEGIEHSRAESGTSVHAVLESNPGPLPLQAILRRRSGEAPNSG